MEPRTVSKRGQPSQVSRGARLNLWMCHTALTRLCSGIALLGLAMSASCGEMPNPSGRSASNARTHSVQVDAVARRFAHLFEVGDYAGQWSLLAPVAQSQWPSPEFRVAMLKAKFADAEVGDVSTGEPIPGVSWINPETLLAQTALWQVPVSMRFRNPSALAPSGVADSYANLRLYLAWERDGPKIVSEGPASMDAPVLIPASITSRQAHVAILMYHLVEPYPDQSLYQTAYDYRLDYGLTVDPAEFTEQMNYLSEHGYKAISLDRLADYLLYGLPLPSKAVILTFDDGRASPLRYAVPVLRQHGFTATFFIPSGLIGTNTTTQHYLTADQVAELSQTGFWIEDHTVRDNTPLWGLNPAQVESIAGASKEQLQALTGMNVQFIAYTGLWPYTDAAESGPAERQLFDQLQRLGYVGGLVDARQNANLEVSTQLWQLPRIRVNPREPISTFASWL